jgi:hypothetical protein
MDFGHAHARPATRDQRAADMVGTAWRRLDGDSRLALIDGVLARFGRAA